MPKLISSSELKIEWTDIAKREHRAIPDTPRSTGIHLSGVLRYIAIQSGILNIHGSDAPEEEMPLRMAMGMAWENWVVGLMPDMVWQPGEFSKDEIYGTPDGITLQDDGSMVLEEFKCTWKSSRKGSILDQWMWMQQGSGYCNMLSAVGSECSRVRYNIFYVNGDYRQSGPQFMRYLVEFSEGELKRNWDMVRKASTAKGVVRE